VRIVFNAMPVEILGNGAVTGVRVEYTRSDGQDADRHGRDLRHPADQVLKAIGQTLEGAPEELELTAARSRSPAPGGPPSRGLGRGRLRARAART
jgi:dihydropyrimidine dehydrogenase (NAD+) subunit PreT